MGRLLNMWYFALGKRGRLFVGWPVLQVLYLHQVRSAFATELCLRVCEDTVKRGNTLSASPKPSREGICADAGDQTMSGDGGGGEAEGNEGKTVLLEEMDQEEPKKETRSQQYVVHYGSQKFYLLCL